MGSLCASFCQPLIAFNVDRAGRPFIDAAGAPQALTEVIAMAKFRAKISAIALYKKDSPINLFKIMMNEIMLIGSIALGRHAEFGEAIDMISTGATDLEPIISHRIPFCHFDEALETPRCGQVGHGHARIQLIMNRRLADVDDPKSQVSALCT